MVSVSLQSLEQLCCIRIAYLMWTLHDLNKKLPVKELFDQLVDIIKANVQKLPLPQQVKSPILQIVKPAGQHLLQLLDSWILKTQPENGEEWLIWEMLFEYLTLNADGLINERKTAEKILGCRMLLKCSRVFAFRLACVNCLKKEVLQLWTLARHNLLRKVLTESGDFERLSGPSPYRCVFARNRVRGKMWKYIYTRRFTNLPRFSCMTESDEVLFWLSFCLSKENDSTIEEIPHFAGKGIDWYEYSLESAAFSGNVAWFDYFINIFKREVEYDYAGMIIGRFFADERKKEQSSFIFHYMHLDSEVKAELFRVGSRQMVNYFLQWPLSQTFVENAEEMWNLIPDEYKKWVFLRVFAILFHANPLLNPITDYNGRCPYLPPGYNYVIHSVDHLREIWIALWKISPDSHKLEVLKAPVFNSIENSVIGEFITVSRALDLKNKLHALFLSNGEAVLELYEKKTMKEALIHLVSKYIPDDFEDINCEFSHFKYDSEEYREEVEREMAHKIRFGYGSNLGRYLPNQNQPKPVNDKFLNFIKKVFYFN